MKLKVYDHSANYTATVIRLPHAQVVEGLDNLRMVEIFGNKCLISKDSDYEQLYLFFPSGTQLSPEFLRGNNLYRDIALNADPNQKGFFEPNGRVKAIKFRGIISSGFVIPVHSLKNLWTDGTDKDWACGEIARLNEGDEFNEFDDKEVCRKYIVNVPSTPGEKKDRTSKLNVRMSEYLVPNQFRFHTDTPHFAKHISEFKPDDVVLLTDKWHGSSCILSQVLVSNKLNLWQKFLNLLGGNIPKRKFAYIYSSGKPKSALPKGIEGSWINDGPDFYTSNIWKQALDDYREAVQPGISIYSELVGYEKSGSFIQKGYDYGTEPLSALSTPSDKTYRMVVYRITHTSANGDVIEFTWPMIKAYCEKYGMETVKELYYGTAANLVDGEFDEDDDFGAILFQELQQRVELMGNCKHCSNFVPAEGIVISKDGGRAYKLKASQFLAKESNDADKGETNIEDNA